MLTQTSRFGEIEVEDDQIITFPTGLLGFSGERHFVIREDEVGSPFRWLQALDTPELAFVMIEPQFALETYELELSSDHLKKLEAEKLEGLTVYVLVTMAKVLSDVTINLQGPLLFNLEKRIGLQFIIPDGKYTTRHPLFGDKLKKDANESTTKSKSAVNPKKALAS